MPASAHCHRSSWFAVAVMVALLSACAADPGTPAAPAPSTAAAPAPAVAASANLQISFVDVPSFDKELSGSLASKLSQVEVAFFDKVTPSALPARLEKWMAAVEVGKGTVKVVPPKSTVAPKNPLLLLSVVSSIYSANKLAHAAATTVEFFPAHAFNADILLKVDDKGDTVVDKVVFARKPG